MGLGLSIGQHVQEYATEPESNSILSHIWQYFNSDVTLLSNFITVRQSQHVYSDVTLFPSFITVRQC